jgi:hypothetical protein
VVIPRRLISAECVLGTAAVPREVRLALQRRYEAPGVLARDLAGSLRDGADGLLLTPCPPVRATLAALPSAPVWALLPNVPQYVRDSADGGLLHAALGRMRHAGPRAILRLGLTAAGRLHRLVRGEFAGLLPLLLELEHAALGARDLRAVALAAPITDLLLAAGNEDFFGRHLEFVRRRFGVAAGFETGNLGHLLARLAAWRIVPNFVIGPLNRFGVGMKPTPAAVLTALASSPVQVLAKQIRAGTRVGVDEGVAYATGAGAAGVVLDLADLVPVDALSAPGPSGGRGPGPR